MLTITTAPAPAKENGIRVVQVGPFGSANVMRIDLAVSDELGRDVSTLTLESTPTYRTGVAYNAAGQLVVSDAIPSTMGFLSTDFTTWTGAVGGVAEKHLALETRLRSTGRIPA